MDNINLERGRARAILVLTVIKDNCDDMIHGLEQEEILDLTEYMHERLTRVKGYLQLYKDDNENIL